MIMVPSIRIRGFNICEFDKIKARVSSIDLRVVVGVAAGVGVYAGGSMLFSGCMFVNVRRDLARLALRHGAMMGREFGKDEKETMKRRRMLSIKSCAYDQPATCADSLASLPRAVHHVSCHALPSGSATTASCQLDHSHTDTS